MALPAAGKDKPRVRSPPLTKSANQFLPAEAGLLLATEKETEGGSSSEEQDDDYEEQGKSAIYDYASEKSMSHEESKLFYQRGRELRYYDPDTHARLDRARTFSLNYEGRGPRRYPHSGAFNDSVPGRDPSGAPDSQPANKQDAGQTIGTNHLERSIAVDSLDGMSNINEGNQTAPGQEPALNGPNIHPELQEMSSMIQKVLDLRHKYIELSLQRPGDNPKDYPDWKVYPEPPKPVWTHDMTAPVSPSRTTSRASGSIALGAELDLSQSRSYASLASVAEEPAPPRPASPARKQRKPGQDIGSDFDIAYLEPMPGEDGTMTFELDQGSVYQVYESAQALQDQKVLIRVPTLREYYMDLNIVKEVSENGPIKSFAFRELQILDGKFNLHALENSYAEMMESKGVPHRDFYNVRKVDTHVHHSACMNSKHLLRFIKSKLKKSADDIVMFRDGKEMTLQDVFDSLEMTAYDLSIDTLDTHVGELSMTCNPNLLLTVAGAHRLVPSV